MDLLTRACHRTNLLPAGVNVLVTSACDAGARTRRGHIAKHIGKARRTAEHEAPTEFRAAECERESHDVPWLHAGKAGASGREFVAAKASA